MSDHLTKINKLQRVDMLEMGLNPLNPAHVNKYLAGGQVRVNVKENEERIKAVMGDKLTVSLGHASESERPITTTDPDAYVAMMPKTQAQGQPNSTQLRQQLMEDMDDYASAPSAPSGGLMNIREAAPQQSQGKVSLNEVSDRGKKLATNYYNAFIKSLQSPGTASNMAVYKALKAMLEQEQKLQGTQYLGTYQKAVQSIAQQMYNQLKG